MGDEWKDDLEQSTADFKTIVYPVIKEHLDGDQLIPVESVTSEEMKDELDRLAGIDMWILDDEGMRGLASRVQYGKCWDTFTVRKSRASGARTEFQKRKSAIESDRLYPHWTCQAYVCRGKLVDAALCWTEDLIQFIMAGSEGEDYITRTVRNGGRATFYVVEWDALARSFDVHSANRDLPSPTENYDTPNGGTQLKLTDGGDGA